MSKLSFAIRSFICSRNDPELKKKELYKLFRKTLRKVDGIEVPYYDIPYELWKGKDLCQVIIPIKEPITTYSLLGQEDKKEIITKKFVLTGQLVNEDSFTILFGNTCEGFNEIKRWIRYFKKVHRRESWKFLKEKIGIPVVVGIILGIPKLLEFVIKYFSK